MRIDIDMRVLHLPGMPGMMTVDIVYEKGIRTTLYSLKLGLRVLQSES